METIFVRAYYNESISSKENGHQVNIMVEKTMYVTKKQVTDFIDREIKYSKISEKELLNIINNALCELIEYPNECKNQIKFYTRVLAALSLAETLPKKQKN